MSKRGRPSIREQVKYRIIKIFTERKTPLNPSQVTMFLEKKYKHKYSHNTIGKYIKELVKMDVLIVRLSLKSKDKKNFTYYELRK